MIVFTQQIVDCLTDYLQTGELNNVGNLLRYKLKQKLKDELDGLEFKWNSLYLRGKRIIAKEKVNYELARIMKNTKTAQFSAEKLFKYCQTYFIGISKSNCVTFLKGNEVNQLYKKPEKKKIYNPILTKHCDERWMMDLCSMTNRIEEGKVIRDKLDILNRRPETRQNSSVFINGGYKYLLTVIDCFSKFAWVRPLKTKTDKAICDALLTILTDDTFPKVIQSDNGGEFNGPLVKALLDDFEIKQIFSSAYYPQANAIVERFNGTLKSMLAKAMENKKTKRWIDLLDDVVLNYNNSYHSTIKDVPSKVHDTKRFSVIKRVRNNIIDSVSKYTTFNDVQKFNVGDKVRIALRTTSKYRRDNTQIKITQPTFSKNIYTIDHIGKTKNGVHIYRIKENEKMYHSEDLLKVK